MGKLRQQAEQRASELLKTSDVKLNREAGTYQLINKATGKTENLPLSGIDVGSGLFAKNRRVNRLIGKSLTRDTEMNTVGEIPAQVHPSTPTPKQPEAKSTTTGDTKPTVSSPVEPWNSTSVQNRFSLGSPSTLVPRRLTFAPDEQFRMGFNSAPKTQETEEQSSSTGPVAYSGMGSVNYGKPTTKPYTGMGSLDYGKVPGVTYPKASALVPKSNTQPSGFDAAAQISTKDLENYKSSMIAASRAHGYNKQEEDRISGLQITSPEVVKAITSGKKTKTIVGLISPYREHTTETEQYNPYSPSFQPLNATR